MRPQLAKSSGLMCLEFIRDWYDVALASMLGAIHVISWSTVDQNESDDQNTKMRLREFGHEMVSSASTTGIVAVSILIPASLLVLQLSIGVDQGLAAGLVFDLKRAGFWFLLSLFAGLLSMWHITSKAQSRNEARQPFVGIALGVQMVFLLVGMSRLVIAIWGVTIEE